MATSPRVLHLNDCAFVGQNIIAAAARAGYDWRMLSAPWPKLRPGETKPRASAEASALVRRWTAQFRAEVVHVHYGRTARLVYLPFMPPRPYVLHLHGTDIRTLWKDPAHHARIQTAVDRAQHVFYTTRDLEGNATQARADAEYMPVFVDPAALPQWRPGGTGRRVVFASRWDPVKGADEMIRLAARLRAALPPEVELVGLDWGESAQDARAAGVRLVPKMGHREYLGFLAGCDVAIGQTNTVLGVSEIEAMGIGLPLAGMGSHLPGPDGGDVPLLGGSLEDVVEQVVDAVADPRAAADRLGSQDWVAREHTADSYVSRLLEVYRGAIERYGTQRSEAPRDIARMARTAWGMLRK